MANLLAPIPAARRRRALLPVIAASARQPPDSLYLSKIQNPASGRVLYFMLTKGAITW